MCAIIALFDIFLQGFEARGTDLRGRYSAQMNLENAGFSPVPNVSSQGDHQK